MDSAGTPAAVVICELFGLVAAVVGYFAISNPLVQSVMLATLVIMGAVCNDIPRYKVRIPSLEAYYDRASGRTPGAAVSLEDHQSASPNSLPDRHREPGRMRGLPPLSDREVLERWASRFAKSGVEKPKLAIVAVSGGASRAAIWTAAVLTALERTLPDFSRHVRLMTGASGGMVASACYAAALEESGGFRGDGRRDDWLVEAVSRDNLTPVADSLALHDIPLQFLPVRKSRDRGSMLDAALEENTDGVLGRPFRELAAGEAEGWRPSLVFSPMLVEDGRRLLISNLDLAPLTRAAGTLLGQDGVDERPEEDGLYSLSAVEFHRLFPEAERLKISTAVRMNATFPYVSPAVRLPVSPARRVVDAGYYDNYGINVAASWIQEHREWIRLRTSGVVLIQVRAFASEKHFRAAPVSFRS